MLFREIRSAPFPKHQQKGTTIKFVCPVYLSAKGFEPSVEAWLHEQGVLTADRESWEGVSKLISP
jgi:hypothetical protein